MATVLVIEEDPETARVIAEVLARNGHHVVTAADGAEGLASAHASRPDAIIVAHKDADPANMT